MQLIADVRPITCQNAGRKRAREGASGRLARVLVVAAALLAACACSGPLPRAQRLAKQGGLQELTLPGSGFQHSAYARVTDGDSLLVLFIEGDGSPWVKRGQVIASDPTPHKPAMLQLAARTPGSVLYLGRPCYFAARSDPACEQRWWTSARYALPVVTSLASAAERFTHEHHLARILLVGHSGGGTLAVLLARRLPGVVGVISIAGNLDPEEWTRQHGYLPLSESVDPVSDPPLDPKLPQWYLLGGRDTVVSEAMAQRYLARVPAPRIWRYPELDHSCCWQQVWPAVYAQALAELGGQGTPGRPSAP